MFIHSRPEPRKENKFTAFTRDSRREKNARQ